MNVAMTPKVHKNVRLATSCSCEPIQGAKVEENIGNVNEKSWKSCQRSCGSSKLNLRPVPQSSTVSIRRCSKGSKRQKRRLQNERMPCTDDGGVREPPAYGNARRNPLITKSIDTPLLVDVSKVNGRTNKQAPLDVVPPLFAALPSLNQRLEMACTIST